MIQQALCHEAMLGTASGKASNLLILLVVIILTRWSARGRGFRGRIKFSSSVLACLFGRRPCGNESPFSSPSISSSLHRRRSSGPPASRPGSSKAGRAAPQAMGTVPRTGTLKATERPRARPLHRRFLPRPRRPCPGRRFRPRHPPPLLATPATRFPVPALRVQREALRHQVLTEVAAE